MCSPCVGASHLKREADCLDVGGSRREFELLGYVTIRRNNLSMTIMSHAHHEGKVWTCANAANLNE
jgi:hypothetical protein